MEISSSCNTAVAAATVKTPEADSETPMAAARIYPAKPLSYSSNGVLKRLNQHHRHGCGIGSNGHHAVVVHYRECLKNHAAALGGHAVDGCGEFMASPTANPADPTSLKCAACGCHRNFHRREPPEEALSPHDAVAALEYQPHHRHHPPPPPQAHRGSGCHSSPNSSSPPPISSAYYPSAPHVLLALGTGLSALQTDNTAPISVTANHTSVTPPSNPNGRKRFRTKFTQDQKDKMLEFAEKIGWKIQKRDEDLINELCAKIGVERGVLKVWMHNNKNTVGKKDQPAAAAAADNAHGVDFDLVSTKSHNLASTATATATATAPACQFDVKNENNSRSVTAALTATNGSFYSS